MDIVLRNARLPGQPDRTVDIGIAKSKITAIESALSADAEKIDLGGRLVCAGFVETHLHLDKSCILDRCGAERGDLDEAISEVAKAKKTFTAEDVYQRAKRTLERCILNGTTHIRTQLEVDPGIGLKGLEGVLPLVKEYAWAVDLEICVFPQEGMLNNPGTEELMLEALRRSGGMIGACPYTDSDPHGQIDRIFVLAREHDLDIDMHLDFTLDPSNMDLLHVCKRAEDFKYGGRVAIGHVSKMSALDSGKFAATAKRMQSAGIALTVLPSTDIYLMGRAHDHNVPRGVTHTHKLLHHGVNCSLATNNVLNPFTPFGDCSLLRMANFYANVAQVGTAHDIAECFHMVTSRAAQLMNLSGYGLKAGNDADIVVLDCQTVHEAVRELPPVLSVFKRGRRTVTREAARLHRP